MELKDRNAIVTGGANGIGQAIALRLAREGANVAVVDIDSKQTDKVVSEIKALGRKGIAITADVTKMSEVKLMTETVLEKLDKIDILINNAGGSARSKASLFCESTEKIWDYVINLNLKGVFNCSRAVIEHMMQKRNGKIVNISSCTGLVGGPMMVDYSAAKAGVIGFTTALAKEVARYGINVNAVAPGLIGTNALHTLRGDIFEFQKLEQRTGLGRVGKPEEIAAMVVFLTTEDADFITGQVFPVCGLENLGVS
jgi:3-oxoacyl-[acyl-carrier protein] reductase